MKKWLLVCALFAVTACSGKNNDTSTPADAGPDAADTASVNNVADLPGMPDMTVPDPLDVGPDATPDLAPDMPADVQEFPDVAQQNCAHPTTDPTCPMGAYGAGTFLNFIEVVETNACCRDLTGDGVIDNKIGQYVSILGGIGGNVNANIDEAVQAGQLAYVLEYANWGNETFDGDLDFRVFLGADDDLDFADNLAGMGSFFLRAESFDVAQNPKWNFEDVTVNNGHMVARGGTLELFFPGLLDQVQMLMKNVRIEADVVPPADLASGGGVALDNGTISGALDRDLFYSSMNEAANTCTCLAKNVFVYDAADDDYKCDIDATDEANCEFDPVSGCRFLSNRQACQFLQLASGDIDVDADGDGTVDSFSVGVRFTGIGARILGPQ